MMRNQLMRNRAMVSYKTQLYGKKCGPMVGWLVASCEPVDHATTPALLPGPVRNPPPIHERKPDVKKYPYFSDNLFKIMSSTGQSILK